jgi:hypothetical protein
MTINSKDLVSFVNSESFEMITNSNWRSNKRQNSRCMYSSVVLAELGECRHSATHSKPRFLMEAILYFHSSAVLTPEKSRPCSLNQMLEGLRTENCGQYKNSCLFRLLSSITRWPSPRPVSCTDCTNLVELAVSLLLLIFY